MDTLLPLMKESDFKHKTDMVRALLTLQREYGLPDVEQVQKAICAQLASEGNAPSCVDTDQKQFILLALQLLQTMGVYNRNFYAELMVQFVDGDRDIRYARNKRFILFSINLKTSVLKSLEMFDKLQELVS